MFADFLNIGKNFFNFSLLFFLLQLQLAVHPDSLALYPELRHMEGRQTLEASLHQVLARLARIVAYPPADQGVRLAHPALLEQRLEQAIVYLGGHHAVELVLPCLGILVFLRRTLAHHVERIVKQAHLGFGLTCSDHRCLFIICCKDTKNQNIKMCFQAAFFNFFFNFFQVCTIFHTIQRYIRINILK